MPRYSEERKEAVLRKLLPPYNMTVAELARQEPALFMRALAEWIVSPRCQHQPTGTALAA